MKRRDFIKQAALGGASLAIAGRAGAAPARAEWSPARGPSGRIDLARAWRFTRAPVGNASALSFDDSAWDFAVLPHAARIEAAVTGPPGSDTYQWQGECWYRQRVAAAPEWAGSTIYLKFDGAMNVADVWLNGRHLGQHLGGYLPFGYDVSSLLDPGRENLLAVRLDNRDNPVTGPKPLAALDFNMYHGLYRDVYLLVKDPLHITDPIVADRVAGGGVFVRSTRVSPEAATLQVQLHVRNDGVRARRFVVRHALLDSSHDIVAETFSEPQALAPRADADIGATLEVTAPRLWSPAHPSLYTLVTELLADGRVVDAEQNRIGIRHLEITADGLRLNGERLFLRGTNRHQEYPYIGYAVSADAQYRDAWHIKSAGFDYVRLSHYAHSPAFMAACDELGLAVMDCIPGWQYFNRADPAFAAVQYENCRRLVRRDRNHPCVFLWEVSLNETDMPPEFIARTHAIAHEEYPGDQCFTCGWTRGYDVFIQARQHGGCHDVTDRPCVVSEYGDWEYYAQNAGLQQEAWANLAPDDANSRQMRWHGERALLQQAANFQEAHNDNLQTKAFADGLWVMYDYNRGYAPDIESSGCMDLFRIPKPASWFFRSQRDPRELLAHARSGPMVFIASDWTPASSTSVRVFSNCDEVLLQLNGKPMGRQRPDRDRMASHLPHPPFTFTLARFEPGLLEASGYLDGRRVAQHAVRTPGPVTTLRLELDEADRPFATSGKDAVFVHATLRDAHGTIVPDAWENVHFGVIGDARLIGANPFSSEAGIASILLQSETVAARPLVYALAVVHDPAESRVLSAATAAAGDVLRYDLRYTMDGSVPGPGSSPYSGPAPHHQALRAALLIGGRTLVVTDPTIPKFRLPGSRAPKPGSAP